MLYFAKWKVMLIIGVCVLGFAFAAPNLLPKSTAESLPDWLPHKQVNLGLDLRGGSHLLLEVEVSEVIREHLEALVDAMRIELRQARIGYTGLGIDGQAATVTIRDADRIEEARELVRGVDRKTTVERDGDTLRLQLTEQAVAERTASAVEQSIEIVRRRIDETGVNEPDIQRQGQDRILVQLPGVDDPDRIKRLLGKTAKMTFHLLDPKAGGAGELSGSVPPGSMLMDSADETTPSGQPRKYVVRRKVEVGGEHLIDAQPTASQQTGEWVVSFRFDSLGAKKFGDVTRTNVGRNLAIILDGKVISAPVIREPILGGNGQISGGFTAATAQDLALLLRAGALPAPLTILEERTVGPGLGADSIAAGKTASIVGLIAVIAFMVVGYGLFGAFANGALLINIVLIFAVLSALQATLTLPGIAGIVLTIGMAVDANVLIFERIREEARRGRPVISAIDSGYKEALSAIIDANVTTLIAATLLYAFGSGPVRGFAVTLAIGIITSLFTATILTRLVIATWLRRRKPAALPI